MAAQAKLPPWGNALAGATGAVLANALVYPLDIVKTRLQVQVKHKPSAVDPESPQDEAKSASRSIHYDSTWDAITKIIDQEGPGGLYAGIAGSLLGVASTNFAYFYWYTTVRRLYLRLNSLGPSRNPGTVVELSIGAVSGALAQLFTIPVAVVTTLQQTQPSDQRLSLVDTAKGVVNGEDGVSGLWRGLKASLVLVINPSITYGAYQRLKDILYPGKDSLHPGQAFLLGAISKILATLVTQPLIVAKVGLQSQPPPERKGKPFKGFVEVMQYIVKHEGAQALFKGIGPQILKGFLVQGLLMTTKERMEYFFVIIFSYIRKLQSRRGSLLSRAV